MTTVHLPWHACRDFSEGVVFDEIGDQRSGARYVLVTWEIVQIHDQRPVRAFDHVQSVEAKAKQPATAERYRPHFVADSAGPAPGVPQPGARTYPEDFLADDVDLHLVIRRDILLNHHGLRRPRRVRQLGRAAHDPNAYAPSPIVRLDDHRLLLDERPQHGEVRRHPRPRGRLPERVVSIESQNLQRSRSRTRPRRRVVIRSANPSSKPSWSKAALR